MFGALLYELFSCTNNSYLGTSGEIHLGWNSAFFAFIFLFKKILLKLCEWKAMLE